MARGGFRFRLWLAFLVMLALVGLGTIVLAMAQWSGLEAWGVGLAMLLVSALSVRAIVRRLAGPVEQLSEATRRFGEGELGYRIPIRQEVARWAERRRLWRERARRSGRPPRRRFDELLSLGSAWNDMADRIERMLKSQKELLANVSHELRSPLARVRVALELVPRTPETERRLGDIGRDLDELERLIDDVLTTSRLDATGLPTRLERVAVAGLLGELAARAATDPTTAKVEVHVQVSPAVSDIMADAGLLRRALWNLIENAGKYGAGPIVLSALPDGEGVCLSVADAGPGVPAELRATLFEPFTRAARDRAQPGFGLGLTIAKKVAEVHGGSIRLADTASGTRFDLTLPRL